MTAARTVAVVGSGSETHEVLAGPLGALIARLGANLLTGGGAGAMSAVCRAYADADRRGTCIGVIPCVAGEPTRAPDGYPNPWLDVVVRTHLPERGTRGASALSRNHIIVLSADAIVALPGGAGTASEITLALGYGRPTLIYCTDDASVRHLPESVRRVTSLDDVEIFLRSTLAPTRRDAQADV